MNNRFTGPLFLVGMPRSGTKLLRAMLHRHPHIRFATIETEFFPYWVAQWREKGVKHEGEAFGEFYKECMRLPFFIQYIERGTKFDFNEWKSMCADFTAAGVFEGLLRYVLAITPEDTSAIWADKSPSYLRHIPLLFEQFPQARFIHIVRDVRDCCLSANQAWGKSMLRVAQRWHDDVSKCRSDAGRFPHSYIEIRYEDLLAEPAEEVRRLCHFLGVEFDTVMLSPGENTENLGDAKGSKTLVSGNVYKYRSKMSEEMTSRIEQIACGTLRDLHYSCAYEGKPVRVPTWRMRWLKLTDAFGLLRHIVAKRGWIDGIRFFLDDYRVSGNREH